MALDVPGRERDLERLVAMSAAMVANGTAGRTVFVAGDEGSGRTALLHAVADALERHTPRPVVLAGGFQDGRYVPRARAAQPDSKVVSVLEQVVSLAAPIVPYAGLVGEVLSKSKAAQQLVRTMFRDSERPDPSVLAPRLLRELCEESPVVCVIDDADRAQGGWWGDLVLLFAQNVAKSLPLLLILGVDGPRVLGAHADDESESLYVARRLAERGLAIWHPLAALTPGDLEQWTGPAAPRLLRSLLEVTGGRAAWAAEQWSDWRRRGVVVQDERDRRWHFGAGGRERALDPIGDMLGERLKRLIGESELKQLDHTRELLACAALEGRSFTADAVAQALGRDRDEVIDLFDDALTRADSRPDGMLTEVESVSVGDETGERHLWRYRFNSELDWLTLLHHGLTDAERRRHGLALAQALQTGYGGQAHRVARTLARLYGAAGDAERAAYFRRMADIGASREVILWRARAILDAPEAPDDRAERRRAAQTLVAAAEELFHSGPFTDGLAFAAAGSGLAPPGRDEAEALYLTAHHRARLGAYEQARAELRRVLALWRELGDRRGEADARHALASIELELGGYEPARAEFTLVLALRRALGDRHGEAHARHQLASIDAQQGAHEPARAEFARVLALRRELGDRHGEAEARHALATIYRGQGAYEQARAEFVRVLALRRELGDRHGEVEARHGLARIDLDLGALEEARAEFARVLALQRELGDRQGEAAARLGLARIDLDRGAYEQARAEFARVLALKRELGDRHGEAEARHALATTDRELGAYEQAREEFARVLALCRELGDRGGEAATRHGLGQIALEQGEHEQAREEFARAIALQRELGDQHGEAATRHELARVDTERRA